MVDSVNRKEKNNMKDVENKVRAIIAKHYRISEDDVKPDSSFITDFGGDSLDIIELVLILEDKYGIEVPEDIAEELDRLKTHITEVLRIIKQKEPVGRRLDFLMQEMNREANTLGSKAADIEMTQIAIELKVLIEQVREQIQNIE